MRNYGTPTVGVLNSYLYSATLHSKVFKDLRSKHFQCHKVMHDVLLIIITIQDIFISFNCLKNVGKHYHMEQSATFDYVRPVSKAPMEAPLGRDIVK